MKEGWFNVGCARGSNDNVHCGLCSVTLSETPRSKIINLIEFSTRGTQLQCPRGWNSLAKNKALTEQHLDLIRLSPHTQIKQDKQHYLALTIAYILVHLLCEL